MEELAISYRHLIKPSDILWKEISSTKDFAKFRRMHMGRHKVSGDCYILRQDIHYVRTPTSIHNLVLGVLLCCRRVMQNNQ